VHEIKSTTKPDLIYHPCRFLVKKMGTSILELTDNKLVKTYAVLSTVKFQFC